jgi:predicted Zn-dependent peptidase
VSEVAVRRAVTRREAGFLWRLEGLGRRVAALQRYLMYLDDPAGLGRELSRYRAVTRDAVIAAAARCMTASSMVEVETRALRAGPAIAVTAAESEELA